MNTDLQLCKQHWHRD